VYDTEPPDTEITRGASGLTNDSTPTFNFVANESSTFECKVDTGAYAPCTNPETTDPLSEGLHHFAVRATDAADNTDPTPAVRAFTVDTVPPDTTISSGPSGLIADNTPTFGFTSSQPGSSFQCRVDGGSFAPCNSPKTLGPLPDGLHSLGVRAIDAAHNMDASPATGSFTVDHSPPSTTITSGPSGPTTDTTPTFGFTSNEPGSTFECKVDAAAYASCASPKTTATLATGHHTFFARAVDHAGNTDPTPATRAFAVSAEPPQTTITGGPTGLTNDSTPTFSFTSDQPGSTFQCSTDNGAFTPCASPKSTAPLGPGSHTFSVRAVKDGVMDPTPASRTFTVDATPPNTSITSGPVGSTTDTTPTFSFTSTESPSTFQCKVDGAAFAPCASPKTTPVLALGPHVFSVRATDHAGNTDATPAVRGFTVKKSR
jgi:hypothetical protein